MNPNYLSITSGYRVLQWLIPLGNLDSQNFYKNKQI